ncbi:VTT domain-containing protein [Kallotenue papyrolyticum]|uniref:VTT domain-containing protein n=1 Tax=Kallotenue papyrolyticum TaxID=1325125 RepID=UPI0005BE11D1|nr:VTT domain-containing protein [Kallotenue papyrolyticum]
MEPGSDLVAGRRRAMSAPRRWIQPLVSLLGALLLSGALIALPLDVERWGRLGYLGVFVLTLLSSATILIPSAALGAALKFGAAATLNPVLVGLLAGLAAGVGESTGYLAGRSGAQLAQMEQRAGYRQIAAWVRRFGVWPVLALAAVPLPLIDLAGLAAGALGMPFWRFLSACTLGKVVRFVPVALLGAWLRARGWL